jgi:hypothetical protein
MEDNCLITPTSLVPMAVPFQVVCRHPSSKGAEYVGKARIVYPVGPNFRSILTGLLMRAESSIKIAVENITLRDQLKSTSPRKRGFRSRTSSKTVGKHNFSPMPLALRSKLRMDRQTDGNPVNYRFSLKVKPCTVGIKYCPTKETTQRRQSGSGHNKAWDDDCAEYAGRPGACLDGGYFSAKKGGPGIRSMWIVTEKDPRPAHEAYYCKAYTSRTKEKGKAAKCSGESRKKNDGLKTHL